MRVLLRSLTTKGVTHSVRFAPCAFRGSLCASCLSKEVEEGHRHSEGRHSAHRAEVARCGTLAQGDTAITRHIEHETNSGNVFADIGLPNAEEHHLKAKLVSKIDKLMQERGLKQVASAEFFGVKQPDISKILRGDFRQFSVDRLMRFLVALGQDVEIVVRPHRGTSAAHSVGS